MTEQLSPSNGSKARQNAYMSLLKWGVLQSGVGYPDKRGNELLQVVGRARIDDARERELTRVEGLSPESLGQIMALLVLYVPERERLL